MSRKIQVLIAIVALLIAAAVGFYVYRAFSRMVTSAQVVTPAMLIPAGALIEPGMLAEREVPRPLLEENIYVSAQELVGRVAVVPLSPGMVVYRPFAVGQREYRLVDDPALEVVSFPVDPARAVGGQLQPGHKVDIWRLVTVRPASGITLTEMASTGWATATLLVEDAPVVDVRAASGQAAARSPQAVPGQVEGQGQQQQRSSSPGTLQILTVAVPPEVARVILALVAEETAGAELWVSLAPLIRVEVAQAQPASAPTPALPALSEVEGPAPTRTPAPTAQPTLTVQTTPIPTPSPIATPAPETAVITGTAGRALQVRDAPAGNVLGSLAEGTTVTVLEGPVEANGAEWYRVQAPELTGWVSGNYLASEGEG